MNAMSVAHTRNFCNYPPIDFNSDRLVSDSLCAELLGISLSTLRRLDEAGQAPPKIKISQRRNGRRLRDIGRYIDRRAAV
jgi:predicted DNA-binding transcriptional regulator AlpA